MRNDLDENKELYGAALHNKEILMTSRAIPAAARPLVASLNRYSRHEAKNRPIESRAADAVENESGSGRRATRKQK